METFLFSFAAFFACMFFATAGGVLYRWRGGGEPEGWGKYMPRPVDQILFSLPYIGIAYFCLPAWPASILSVITVAAVCKGHGRNMDLGTFDNSSKPGGVSPEWYEGIIGGLYGKIPEYWYDALGLAISGMTYTIPVGLFIADPTVGLFWPGVLLAASGALKAPSYMMGKWMTETFELAMGLDEIEARAMQFMRLREFTEWGEFLTGFALWACATGIFISIMFLG